MPSVRGEITRTLLRLSRRLQSRPDLREAPSPRRHIPAFRAGSVFGKYKIVKRLGAGGMGQVYLATQEGLNRPVALKFLSPELVAQPDMLRRLLEEARMASALNHPNIVTIHEVGEHSGAHFIASEYIEGQTLRSALNRRELDTQGGIDVVCQILSALKKAHSAGIIHRDLKPGNIMIRSDGYVKVIDFGLAKRTREAAEIYLNGETSLTRPGAVVGTVFYMSPEQACGETVDQRTDLWSLGVILYEIVMRRRPFEGDSDNRVVVNICSRPAPNISNVGELPTGLAAVIERSLQKNPADRYPSAQEMLDDLSTVGLGATGRSATRPAILRPTSSRRMWLLIAAGLTLLVAVAILLAVRAMRSGPDWFQVDKVRQLTFNGRVLKSAISEDGRYIAYSVGETGGAQALYLAQVNGSSESIRIPAHQVDYAGLTFAPDNTLFVVAKSQDDLIGRVFEVPVVGEPSKRPLITDVDGPVTFSPTGDQLAFVRWTPNSGPQRNSTEGAIYVAPRDGSQIRKLFSSTQRHITQYIDWAPDGKRIAALLRTTSGATSGHLSLALIGLDGKEKQRDLPDWQVTDQVFWNPNGRTLFITASDRKEAGLNQRLRQIDVSTGEMRDLLQDTSGFRSGEITKDGAEIAVVKIESKANLWVSAPNDFGRGQSSWAETERKPNLTWMGNSSLVLGSVRGGYPNLWLSEVDEQTREVLTHEPFAEQEAAALAGTRSVIYTSRRSGQMKIWRYDAETNRYRQLTFGPNSDTAPTVSGDGRRIVYVSSSATTSHLFRMQSDGSQNGQLTSYPALDPSLAPDGHSVLARIQDPRTGKWTLAIIPLEEGASGFTTLNADYKTLSIPGANAVWAPDGKGITTSIENARGVSNIWLTPLDGGHRKQLTNFEEQQILKFAWSPNGDRLACLRTTSARDVALYSRHP